MKGVFPRFLLAAWSVFLIFLLTDCGGGISNPPAANIKSLTALSITTSSLPTGTEQQSYQARMQAIGGLAPYHWKVSGGALPAGLNLSSGGMISGTPSTAGLADFSVSVTDTEATPQTTRASLQIAIATPPAGSAALSIQTSALPGGTAQTAYQATLSASGGQSPYTWKLSGGTLPAGLTLTSGGAISGTPGAAGTARFSVSVSDAEAKPQTSSASFQITIQNQDLALDPYGGLAGISVDAGTGFFTVNKVGSRWVFTDPDGHPFWMLGVFAVDLITDTSTGSAYTLNKYGGSRSVWGLQAVRRLQHWGFNTAAEYASAYVVPLNKNGSYETSDPLPWVDIMKPSYYSLRDYNHYAPAPVKDLVAGLDAEYTNFRGDPLPDVFDPNYAAYAQAFIHANTSAAEAQSPWLVGTATDDTDELWGFGPGPDLPAARQSSNIGWLVLCTNFAQSSNARLGETYTDTKVYSKYALRDWLENKYGTIAALNTAWGSDYTTFDDAGGYGSGTGLLDEDGRHAWVGHDDISMSTAQAQVRADLNAFLAVFANQYFSVVTAALRQARPNQLVFGPATLNGWGGISRRAILAAAAKYTDVVQASMSTQAVYDLSLQYAGDRPFVTWIGMPANPDSDLAAYPNPADNPVAYTSQAARGAAYAQTVESDFAYTGSAAAGALEGSSNVIGAKFWAWCDSWGEKTNWGLVSFMDNAYDGKEDVTANGLDNWGFAIGGESGNYGDFITPASTANEQVLQELGQALHP